jgi:hypothetical protein
MVPFIKGPYEGLPFHRFPASLSLFCFYIKKEQAIYQYGGVGDAVISDVPAVENLKFKSAVREEESKSYSNKTCLNYFHFTL